MVGNEVVRFDSVSKTYRIGSARVNALVDVSLSAHRGTALAILGANGAGKSTLLKLASGLGAPSAGRITRVRRVASIIELGLGMHPDLTGRENLALVASLYSGAAPSPHQTDQIIEFSGVGEVVDEPTRHLSNGQVARLAFSAGTHSGAELLLIDEVLSVGDLEFQHRCRERIEALRSSGITILLASHDLETVSTTCTHGVLLDRGRIVAQGDVAAVVRHYVGDPPMAAHGEVEAALLTSSVSEGEEVVVDLTLSTGSAPEVRFDYLFPTTTEMRSTGHTSELICGTAYLALSGDGSSRVALSTRGLPRGQYLLRVTVGTSDAKSVTSTTLPFHLGGDPGPMAVRLDASVHLAPILAAPS